MATILKIGEPFRIIADALESFGIQPKGGGGPKPSVYWIDRTKYLWFPKLAVQTPDGKLQASPGNNWRNLLSASGTELTEKWVGAGPQPAPDAKFDDTTVDRALFAYSQDASGIAAYRFAGVFRKPGTLDAYGAFIYKQTADTLSIDDWKNAYAQYAP